MAADIQSLRPYLEDFDLTGLMVEELGWNHHRDAPVTVSAGGEDFLLSPVAEKAGFAVYRCGPNANGAVPPQSVRRQIETQVVQVNFEHMIIFVDAAETRQVWQWIKRESGRPPAIREMRYDRGQSGTALLQRLRGIEFTLEEEGNLGITDVIPKVLQSLDVERVTKRFYERFREELSAFQKFIDGFTAQGDLDWYASLMLNRLMFVYFIQKQGFLDGDEHYLRSRLKTVQEQDGPDQFQRFYRKFLLRLFHEGLGKPEADRPAELAALLGKVPYLNGGIFDQHALERDNPAVNIPDDAFRQVFDFFDQYQWHLDDRPTGNDNEINPDVLGYIFEKYVNQKQMGAYYTKEDITGYIARNTVIPRLLEMARAECAVAFDPNGGLWRLLQDDPDNYIYPALGHGVSWDYSPDGAARLEEPVPLPDDIACGSDDPTQRTSWNKAAPPEYALPTETWRELIARRRRYEEVRSKLAAGEVQDINDLITLNLDSERFARDVIVNSEGPDLVRAFWHALNRVSVLDPACGSGAFLFAALNILEQLYSAALQAMREFRDDLETSRRPRNPNALSEFREALAAAGQHRSERYYILKSIIVNNLYGVDIMEEAVEICRLRLFLKLAAQLESVDEVEPLPDIDFNIQPGNSLVGFTSDASVRQAMEMTLGGQRRMLDADDQDALGRIETAAGDIARQHSSFQQIQTEYGMRHDQLAEAKQQLQSKLLQLRAELDALLAKEYGVDASKPAPFQQWRASHQPFHWFVEFHGIMNDGGFDVVIGNPPYVATKTVTYSLGRHIPHQYPDLYAQVVHKSMQVVTASGRFGMILPLSIIFSRDFGSLRESIWKWGGSWLSSFDNIPASLFAGVSQRCTILLSTPSSQKTFVSRLYRWRARFRPSLMDNVAYTSMTQDVNVGAFGFPKLSNDGGDRLLQLHSRASSKPLPNAVEQNNVPGKLGFSSTARNFISTYLEPPPILEDNGTTIQHAETGSSLALPTSDLALAGLAATSGATCFWYWLTRGDGFHVTNTLLSDYLAPLLRMDGEFQEKLRFVGEQLHRLRNSALVFKKNAGKYVGNFNYQSLQALTFRADLIYLAGVGADWSDVENVFSHAALVKAINEAAGEKNIPQDIKEQFAVQESIDLDSNEGITKIDDWSARFFSVPESRVRTAILI